MLSLVTISPVITAFHSCLSHHVFDQVNLWLAWVGIETAIFWQCSPGTVETPRLYPLLSQKRGAIDNNYGRQYLLGIRLQDSAFLSEVAVDHLKKARGEIWPKRSEKKKQKKKKKKKTTKMRKKVHNK